MKQGFLTLDEIRQLFSLLKENDVTEFSLDLGDDRISLKRRSGSGAKVEENDGKGGGHSAASSHVLHLVNSQGVNSQGVNSQGVNSQGVNSQGVNSQGVNSQGRGSAGKPSIKNYHVHNLEGIQGEAVSGNSNEVLATNNLKEIRSPMVGTFFSKPAIDMPPFVSVGDHVVKGQVICIIEAMKVMNEVESDTNGRVVEITLNDGQVVEFEEVIFRVDPCV